MSLQRGRVIIESPESRDLLLQRFIDLIDLVSCIPHCNLQLYLFIYLSLNNSSYYTLILYSDINQYLYPNMPAPRVKSYRFKFMSNRPPFAKKYRQI